MTMPSKKDFEEVREWVNNRIHPKTFERVFRYFFALYDALSKVTAPTKEDFRTVRNWLDADNYDSTTTRVLRYLLTLVETTEPEPKERIMIGLICNDELYLVEKTPEMVELIQKHLKEVGTRPTEVVPETHTQEWKDYNLKYWPATAALEEMFAELEPTPMPYNNHAMDMIVRIAFCW